MISKHKIHKSQTLNYDIIHDFKVSLIRWQPPQKMLLPVAGHCQSSAWPHQAEQVQNTSRQQWSVILPNKAWPVIVAWHIKTCHVLCCQLKLQRGAWWDNLLAWSSGIPRSWIIAIDMWMQSWHTDLGLQECLMISTVCGCLTGHLSDLVLGADAVVAGGSPVVPLQSRNCLALSLYCFLGTQLGSGLQILFCLAWQQSPCCYDVKCPWQTVEMLTSAENQERKKSICKVKLVFSK